MPCPEDILRSCGSLIGLSESNNIRVSVAKQVNTRTVSAAHASVVDFLRGERVRVGSVKEFPFTERSVSLEMAQICLVYLLNIIEEDVPLNYKILKNHPMAHRSAELWAGFYLEATKYRRSDLKGVHRLITRLLESPGAFLKWILLSSWEKDSSHVLDFLRCMDIYALQSYLRSMGIIGDEICALDIYLNIKEVLMNLEHGMKHDPSLSDKISRIRWLADRKSKDRTYEPWMRRVFVERKDQMALGHLWCDLDSEDEVETMDCGCVNTKAKRVYEFGDWMEYDPEDLVPQFGMFFRLLRRMKVLCECGNPMPAPPCKIVAVLNSKKRRRSEDELVGAE